MAVGFRSLLRVDPGQSVIDTVVKHIAEWSVQKEIELDAGAPGRYDLDYDNVVTIVREQVEDATLYRWRRTHRYPRPGDVWRNTFTAVEDPKAAGLLWTEIETVDDESASDPSLLPYMSVPRVLRELLTVLECRDGRTATGAEPQWVGSRHLPDVMDYLADETRLGAVYLASQGQRGAEAFTDWAMQVGWHLVGLGSIFLIDDAMTAEFNEMVGRPHAVPAGTVRTYLPNVDLDDPLDPHRHRILGIGRIAQSNPRRLSGILGTVARSRAANSPLPAEAVEVDRIISACEEQAEPAQPSLHAVPSVQAAQGRRSTAGPRLHRELQELRDELSRERAQRSAILAQLEQLTHELRALRDGELAAQRLSVS